MVQHRFHTGFWVRKIRYWWDGIGNSGNVPVINIGRANFAEVLLLVVDEVLGAEDEMSSSRTYEMKL